MQGAPRHSDAAIHRGVTNAYPALVPPHPQATRRQPASAELARHGGGERDREGNWDGPGEVARSGGAGVAWRAERLAARVVGRGSGFGGEARPQVDGRREGGGPPQTDSVGREAVG